MKLTTIVEIRKDGVSGRSVTTGEVGEGYSDEQLATRTIKQFRTAKEDLIARLTAKRAIDSQQPLLFELAEAGD
jgi:hypothetical protein